MIIEFHKQSRHRSFEWIYFEVAIKYWKLNFEIENWLEFNEIQYEFEIIQVGNFITGIKLDFLKKSDEILFKLTWL